MSKDDSMPTGANAAVDRNEEQAQLKSLHYALVAMRGEQWQRPPSPIQIRVLQAYRHHYYPPPKRSLLPAWFSFQSVPAARMAIAGAFALLALVLFSLLLMGPTAGQTALTATAGDVTGLAEIRPVGSVSWYLLRPGREMRAGDRLRTYGDSRVVMQFPDNSETEVDANTQLALLQLSSTGKKGSQIVVLHQYIGQTQHKIQPQNPDYSWYEVETSSASVTVVGTKFTVHVSESQVTTVFVEEGVVEVTGQETAIALDANQTAHVLPNSTPTFGEADPTNLIYCVPSVKEMVKTICEEAAQQEAEAAEFAGTSADSSEEGAAGADPASAGSTGSIGRFTPTPTNGTAEPPRPGSSPGAQAPVAQTTVPGSTTATPTPDGQSPPDLSATPDQSSTPSDGSATPTWTSTPQPTSSTVPPSPTQPGSPTWTPSAPPPSSTPVPPPPTSTPVPPPPTSTPLPPPPTSTPVPPPPTSTPVPPPPTPTPPPTAYPPPPTPTTPPYP